MAGTAMEAERRDGSLAQAALRRIATLVARGVQAQELFAAVAEEVGRVVGAPHVAVARYGPDATATAMGTFPEDGPIFPRGTRVPLDGVSVLAGIRECGEPVRIDDYSGLAGEVAEVARRAGIHSGVGVPIVVAGAVWGSIVAWSGERLPEDFGVRLADFTELLAAAIANANATEALALVAEQQAALRRVATLAAQGVDPLELFAVVVEEIGRVVVNAPSVAVCRYESDNSVTLCGTFPRDEPDHPVGQRMPLSGNDLLSVVRERGEPARLDDFSEMRGEIGEAARRSGNRSSVGVPILVAGRVWGVVVASSPEPLPESTERHLSEFTELLATAIAEAQAREALTQLAGEQAALRRVATLVAEGAAAPALLAAVAKEVASVLGVSRVSIDRYDPDGHSTVVASLNDPHFPVGSRWPLDGPSLGAMVLETGRPARVEDYATLESTSAAAIRAADVTATVGVPIIVEGRLWGVICVAAEGPTSPPSDTERRLARFTELVATAIANAHSRESLAELVDEQAALRRVATHVAEGAPPTSLFASVADEVASALGVPTVVIGRYGPGPICTVVSAANHPAFTVGSQWPLDGPSTAKAVFEEARAARIEDYSALPGTIASALRSAGISSTVGAPIVVDGSIWGCISVLATDPGLLPADSEERLEEFTRLVAVAISKAASHDALSRLADQQAALRRVATLVAEGAPPAELFTAVCWEVGRLFDFAAVTLNRYERDAVVVIADPLDSGFPVGSRWPFDGDSLAVRVHETHRMARIDDYSEIESSAGARMRERDSRSAMGVPIVVEGELWGLLCVGAAATELLPTDTQDRIEGFVELIGTAIANGQARDRIRLLADEQAALRRVATLVARDARPKEVFDAVAQEVGKLLDAHMTVVGRYDDDGAATAIGSWSAAPGGVPSGTRSAVGGRNVLSLVAETARPARIDGYDDASGEAADIARDHGWRSSIAAPIIVEGRLWGVMLVASQRLEPFPVGAEERLSAFTDLVATAIANAESRSELAASRRRIVAAADEARRRIERDLHDGIQQRLIALTFRARALMRRPADELPALASELSEGLKDVSDELREVSRGIYPTILTEAGLGPALRALARRSTVPIDVDVQLEERLPTAVEGAAYYIASEALTNVAKHAHANVVRLIAAHDEGGLRLEVRDDGIGGVDASGGSGILGLVDRVEALGGTISIASPANGGTTLSVRLPV